MEGVVLAAGLGKRMRPLSYIMPKPLFILGDKTAIEHIVDWLYSNGIYRIHVVLSYSGRIVENVLKGKKEMDFNFVYSKPKGTAGQLSDLKDFIKTSFIVNYCDSIFNFNLKDMIDFHSKNKSILTLSSIRRRTQIKYGVLTYTKNGKLKRWDEKPSIETNVFPGLFIAENRIFDYIEKDKISQLNDLVVSLLKKKELVSVYEIKGEYYDIGTLKRYFKISHIYDNKIGNV